MNNKVCILHISDIHFCSKSDAVFQKAEAIASGSYSRARESAATIIAVTGDIAFSGAVTEYEVAKEFIQSIKSSIECETGKPVHVITVAGNHDCTLKPTDSIRELVIDRIVQQPEMASDESYIKTCVSAQENYFSFRKEIETLEPTYSHELYNEYRLCIGDYQLAISGLNVAWMSRLRETPGDLVFPIANFVPKLAEQSDFRLVLLHQPYNWHQQRSYHQMRTEIRRYATVVLNGHEHIGNSATTDDELSGVSLSFEACALAPHEDDGKAGFAVYQFDLEVRQALIERFTIEDNGIHDDGPSVVLTLPTAAEKNIAAIEFTSAWRADLDNPGANFIHPDKRNIQLEDVFVFPDLRDWENDEPNRVISVSSERLLDSIKGGASALLIGEERCGKTALLHVYARRLFSDGYFPVYVKAGELSNIRVSSDVELRLNRFIEKQYVNAPELKNVPRAKKILLIDDVDRYKSGVAAIPPFLAYVQQHFGAIVLTAGQSFEASSLASSTASEMLRTYPKYEVMRFGQKLRHKLVRKWCLLSQLSSMSEVDRRVHQIEGIINSVIGKNLVPQLPIYLLILLQSCDQHQHGEIQNSGFSHYYQFLITKSLGQVGVSAEELNEYYNYLAHLTWFMHERESKEIGKSDFRIFNNEFSAKFSSVDFSERVQKLVGARLLCQRGDCYSFAYPYVYYFFFGKYLSIKINKEASIKQWVIEACSKLYIRENANAILFLTHHDSDPWIIEKIVEVVRKIFDDTTPMHFNGDTVSINGLVDAASTLVLATPNVEKNQEESRELSDELDAQEDQIPDATPNENGELEFVAKFVLLFKTAEILGQILKNYYGSLEKPFKAELLKQVFDAPLRALNLQLQEISSDMEGFVSYIDSIAFKDEKKISPDQREKMARKTAFSFLGWLGTTVVSSSAYFVASDKLREDVAQLVRSNPTVAYRLIDIGTRLVRPGSIPLGEIEKLAKDLKDNHYAFQILQSLGVNHLYLFHTDVAEKSKLCNILKISLKSKRTIESLNKDTKLTLK